MEGKFLSGALLGGVIGAAIVANWDSITKNCSCLSELKKQTSGNARPKTRLMARRYRVKKDPCC